MKTSKKKKMLQKPMKNGVGIIPFILSWFIIPLFLAVGGFLYSVAHYTGASFFTLNHYHDDVAHGTSSLILKNNRTVGFSFQSHADNLGILAIRLKLPETEVTGTITFTLKDATDSAILFVGNYDMEKVFGDRFYPLGFPSIEKSKGHLYRAEFMSTYEKGDPITIILDNPEFITKYHVGKINPLRNPETFLRYLLIKIGNLLPDPEFYAYLLVNLLPVILYLTWKIINNKFVTILLVIFIGYRIYFSVYETVRQFGYEAELYFKLASLLLIGIKFKLSGRIYFSIALFMFLLSTLYIGIQQELIARGYAIWTYYFMTLGVLAFVWQQWGTLFIGYLRLFLKDKQKKHT